jgi:hypothetical protein
LSLRPALLARAGQTAAALCLGKKATGADAETVSRLFNAVGRIYTVNENLIDAVTGLSGSGPAYVFLMIEALSDGGVRAGLPRDIATGLAAQTVAGAAQMVLQTGKARPPTHELHTPAHAHTRMCADDALHAHAYTTAHGRAEGHGDLSRRHDHRGRARDGDGRRARGAYGRRHGGHQPRQGAVQAVSAAGWWQAGRQQGRDVVRRCDAKSVCCVNITRRVICLCVQHVVVAR